MKEYIDACLQPISASLRNIAMSGIADPYIYSDYCLLLQNVATKKQIRTSGEMGRKPAIIKTMIDS